MIQRSGSPNASARGRFLRGLLVMWAALALALAVPAVAHAAVVAVTQRLDVVNGNTTGIAALLAGDGGDGISLREAVEACESDVSLANTILVPANDYPLSLGEMAIGTRPGTSLVIQGAGPTSVLHPVTPHRVFNIDPSALGNVTVVLQGLTLRDGKAGIDDWYGGGALVVGDGPPGMPDRVTVDQCVFESNGNAGIVTGVQGGAISCWPNVVLAVRNCSFINNTVAGGYGGAIGFVDNGLGSVSITDSTFTNNGASGVDGQGGALYLSTGVSAGQEVRRNTFTGNSAAQGGAIYAGTTAGPGLTIRQNRIVGNTASGSGGGLYVFAPGVDASRNWWGSNGGPGTAGSDTAAGTAAPTLTPQLVLRVTSTLTTVTRNASTGVQADLSHDASGNAGYAVPGAPAATWAAGIGAMSPASGSLSNGAADSTFTAAAVGGAGWARATIDNQASYAYIDVPEPPHVTLDPIDVTKLAGQVATFTVGRSGYPTPTVQWQRSTNGGVSFSDISLATSTTYSLTTTATDYGNRYRARFTNVAGEATTTAALLTVYTTPTVTSQPADLTVKAGETAAFTASADGTPSPTVKWQRSTDGGATYGDIGGATSPTYSFTSAASDYGDRYRAVFTNAAGSVTTTYAVLTVHTTPTVNAQPADVTVVAGEEAAFTASAEGTPSPSVRWQLSLDGGLTFDDIPGATSGTYSFTASAEDYGKRFRAVFTNAVDSVASSAALLTVHTTPTITAQPSDLTTRAGEVAVFTASADGTPSPTVRWQVSADGGSVFSDIPGATSSTLSFTSAASDYGHRYRAVFSNAAGDATSTAAVLYAVVPPAVTSAAETTFTVGIRGTFAVTSSGTPTSALTCLGSLPPGVSFIDNGDGTGSIDGTPAAGSGGTYGVTISAANGVAPDSTQSFTMTVLELPAITLQPADVTVPESGTASFVTHADGETSVHWETSADGVTWSDVPMALGDTHTVVASAAEHLRRFRAVFANADGETVSDPATLRVDPRWLIHPADTTVVAGAYATFIAHATSELGLLNYDQFDIGAEWQWSDDGGATWLAEWPSGWWSLFYAFTGETHFGPQATPSMNGRLYRVAAKSLAGETVSRQARLTVHWAPAFTSSAATTFTIDTPGTFIVATGANPVAALSIVSGSLPAGVTFTDNGDGTATVSGTPTAGGYYPLTLRATNVIDAVDQSFLLTVVQSAAFTSAPSATWRAGTAGSIGVEATGTPVPAITLETGTLPAGLVFTDDGDGTAAISGTPGTGTGGVYPLVLRADNGYASPSAPLLVTVEETAAVATQPTDQVAYDGRVATFTAAAYGYPVPTVQWQTSMDNGANWTDVPAATTDTLTLTATGADKDRLFRAVYTNSLGSEVTARARLTVHTAPTFSEQPVDVTFPEGCAAAFGALASSTIGLDPYPSAAKADWMWSTNGGSTWTRGIPPGSMTISYPFPPIWWNTILTIDGTRARNGTLYRVAVKNAAGETLSAAARLTVTWAPGFTSAAESTLTVGAAGSHTVVTSANPTATLSITAGSLPSGVTFTDNGDGTASLAGVPAGGSGGDYPLTVTAANGAGTDATQSFILHVVEHPAVLGANASVVVTEGLVPDAIWAVLRSAPAPLVAWEMSTDGGASWSAVPAGPLQSLTPWSAPPTYLASLQYTVPADRAMNGYLYRAAISNGLTSGASEPCYLDVRFPAAVTSQDFENFRTGTYGEFVVTSSGNPTATLSVAGTLPDGVTFTDNEDGTASLAGTPANDAGGSYPLTITASNGVGADGTQSLTLTVLDQPAFTSADTATFDVGAAGEFTVTATGYPVPSLDIFGGTLPPGLTFVDNGDGTASLAGVPPAGSGGSYPLALSASNGVMPLPTRAGVSGGVGYADQLLTIVVREAPTVTDNPWDAMVRTGETVEFGAGGTGYPEPSVRWQVSTDGGETFTDMPGETASTLSFTATAAHDGKRFRAVFTNGTGDATTWAAVLRVDDAPPVTTFDGPDGVWQSDDTTYSLSAADDAAGVIGTYYRHDGGETVTYYEEIGPKALSPALFQPFVSTVVTVTKEGTTTVEYWSVDSYERVEATRTARILIDRTAPSISHDATSFYTGSARVAFSAEDTGSGTASLRYSLDGAPAVTARFVDVVTNGPHTLTITAEDGVGNTSSVTTTFTSGTRYIPIAGENRYTTAIAASKAAFASGARSVIIATGLQWPDAIAGSSLAGAESAPLLLTHPGTLLPEVADEIRRLGATRAYLLGGPAALAPKVESDLAAMLGAGAVTRIGGATRYDTAALIASATIEALKADGRSFDGVAFIASGGNFPDALAAAPVSWYRTRPILLTPTGVLPAVTSDALASLGVTRTVILGGEGAVGASVEASLAARFPGAVTRLAGPDRYATAARIAEYGVTQGLEWDGTALATGQLFADALSGGVMQGKFRSVVLLTRRDALSRPSYDALRAHRLEIANLRFLGGPAAVSEAVRVEAVNAIEE